MMLICKKLLRETFEMKLLFQEAFKALVFFTGYQLYIA